MHVHAHRYVKHISLEMGAGVYVFDMGPDRGQWEAVAVAEVDEDIATSVRIGWLAGWLSCDRARVRACVDAFVQRLWLCAPSSPS